MNHRFRALHGASDVLPFGGVSKTEGYPHYLSGVPMSAVAGLGYVDRSIGDKGIYSLVDDFMAGVPRVSAANPNPPDETTSLGGVICGPYDASLTGTSYVTTATYRGGAIYLVAGQGEGSAPQKGVILGRHDGHVNFDPDSQLWFACRVAASGHGNCAIGMGYGTAASNPSAVRIDDYLTGNTFAMGGMYFLKLDDETDWSFVIVEYTGNNPTYLRVSNLLALAGRDDLDTLGAGTYVPLAYRFIPGTGVLVYVDGIGVATVATDEAHLVNIFTEDAGQTANRAIFASVESSQPSDTLLKPTLTIDNWLVAQETMEDAD